MCELSRGREPGHHVSGDVGESSPHGESVFDSRAAAPNKTIRLRVRVMAALRPSCALKPRLVARSVVSTVIFGLAVAIRLILDQQRVVLGPSTPSQTNST